MTNQERNIKLAELLGYGVSHIYRSSSAIEVQIKRVSFCDTFNPCENWEQLMPLVVEHRVNLFYSLGDWLSVCPRFSVTNKDPRLALVDCIISVLESKQDETK